jgi:hypothetical protein
MTHRIARLILAVSALLAFAGGHAVFAQSIANSTYASNQSFVAGKFVANNYNYGNPTPGGQSSAGGQVVTGNTVTGSATITVRQGYIVLPDGRSVMPFAVGVPIVISDASPELVVPTAVSGCSNTKQGVAGGADAPFVTCSITASFAAVHGAYAQVLSGTAGTAEAANDAFNWGGGVVVLAPGWKQGLNTSCTGCYATAAAALQALLPYPNVSFEDDQVGPPVYWNVTPAAATSFSAPSALTSSTAFSSLTVTGSASYTGGTIHVCYALVDVMGNEGPCSEDYSFTDTSAMAIQFTAPPAATGAVGWIPYIGLESGAANNEYQVKLVTQPTVIAVYPVAVAGLCTLTTIETITPACAITNTSYGQTGSGAVVAAYPVVTSPQAVGTGGQDGSAPTSYYEGNTNSRTVYQYQPGASVGTTMIERSSNPFHITTAAASTVPQILGTLTMPVGFMNYVGRSIRICGLAYSTTQGASTVVAIKFEWDAQGSDVTTGLPVILGGPLVTNTLTTGTVASFSFCQDLTTTVASASATGGSIRAVNGYLIESALSTGSTPAAGPSDINMTGAVGSLNLANAARIQIVMVQTTSSTAVPQLLNLTVQVLN